MISLQDLNNSIWMLLFLILISSLVFIISYFSVRLVIMPGIVRAKNLGSYERRAELPLKALLACFPFAFTGMIAGFLTGSSRAPAVTALVPAVLTAAGLIMTVVMGKGPLRALAANFSIFIFSCCLLVGSLIGSASRDRHELDLKSIPVLSAAAERELYIRRYRANIGLPPDPPKKTELQCEEK